MSQKMSAYILKLQKRCSECKQAHVGMEPSKTRQTRWEWHQQHFYTIPTFCAICLVLVHVHRRMVEGTDFGSAHGCISAC